MTDSQFQLAMAILGFIGAMIMILLGIIAFFMKHVLANVTQRLDSHSMKHDHQKDWNEVKSSIMEKHSTQIEAHNSLLYQSRKQY